MTANVPSSTAGERDGRSGRWGCAAACLPVLLLVMVAGCADSRAVAADRSSEQAAGPGAARRETAGRPGPPPILVERGVEVLPLSGEALQRASLPLDEVLRRLPAPDYLAAAAEAPGEEAPGADQAEREPPAAAVRAYALGRSAYLEGDRFEAVEQLEQARRLDPSSPQVLRLLGTVYFARGDEVRGAQMLREAVRLEPGDDGSLFLLGRFAFRKERWAEAIVTLARADFGAGEEEQEEGLDPAVPHLRSYYLGEALLRAGYDAAAAEQLSRFLRMPERFDRTTQLLREVAILSRQRGRVRVQIGDALMRLGRVERALAAYDAAEAEDRTDTDRDLLTARRVYALLAMDRAHEAERALIEELTESQPSSGALGLTPYLAEGLGDRAGFVQRLRGVYEQQGRPASLALAIGELLEDEAAAAFLFEHVERKPGDVQVYRRVVERMGWDDPQRLVQGVLRLISARPESARRYVEDLIDAEEEAERLLGSLDGLDPPQRESAAGWYLRGALHEAAGRIDQAAEAYDRALAADDSFLSPHLAIVQLQLDRGRYERALELLEKIPNAEALDVRFARSRALAGLRRYDEASRVLEGVLAGAPRDSRYLLFKAHLQVLRRDLEGAERTLWSILDADAGIEEAYAALFALYAEHQDVFDETRPRRLLQLARRNIPDSPVTRMQMATWHLSNRRFDEAERELRRVLEDEPGSDEALRLLVAVLAVDDRWDEAERMLLDLIEKRPDDPMPLLLLEPVARRLDRMDAYRARYEAFIQRREPTYDNWYKLYELHLDLGSPEPALEALERALASDPQRASQFRGEPENMERLTVLYRLTQQPEKALEQLELALREHPEHGADLHYQRAAVYLSMDQPQKSEQALQAALETNPDHPGANNDLAYIWAEANRNLDRALEMTQKAVEAEPNNSAFLDSLGWVYYKLGRFPEAVRRLEEAKINPNGEDPVILDHLGDALWRVDNRAEAVRAWREAHQRARGMEGSGRPDIAELQVKLEQKIGAVSRNQPPPIAPLPGEQEGAEAPQPQAEGAADAP